MPTQQIVPTSCSQDFMKFYTAVAKHVSRSNFKYWLNRFNRFLVKTTFVDPPYVDFGQKLKTTLIFCHLQIAITQKLLEIDP